MWTTESGGEQLQQALPCPAAPCALPRERAGTTAEWMYPGNLACPHMRSRVRQMVGGGVVGNGRAGGFRHMVMRVMAKDQRITGAHLSHRRTTGCWHRRSWKPWLPGHQIGFRWLAGGASPRCRCCAARRPRAFAACSALGNRRSFCSHICSSVNQGKDNQEDRAEV